MPEEGPEVLSASGKEYEQIPHDRCFSPIIIAIKVKRTFIYPLK